MPNDLIPPDSPEGGGAQVRPEGEESAQGRALAVAPTVAPDSLLSAIIGMAKDPTLDVEKFRALLELQQQLEMRQAEIEFARALARLAAVLPRVPKNGRVSLGESRGSYPFAKWEDMDKLLRPLYTAEGFSFNFTSEERDGGRYAIIGTLRHRDGHSERATVVLPPNSGPGRNELQAMGGTLSYGKRYAAEMLLNIVREGDDNDGANANPFGSFAKARSAPTATGKAASTSQ